MVSGRRLLGLAALLSSSRRAQKGQVVHLNEKKYCYRVQANFTFPPSFSTSITTAQNDAGSQRERRHIQACVWQTASREDLSSLRNPLQGDFAQATVPDLYEHPNATTSEASKQRRPVVKHHGVDPLPRKVPKGFEAFAGRARGTLHILGSRLFRPIHRQCACCPGNDPLIMQLFDTRRRALVRTTYRGYNPQSLRLVARSLEPQRIPMATKHCRKHDSVSSPGAAICAATRPVRVRTSA